MATTTSAVSELIAHHADPPMEALRVNTNGEWSTELIPASPAAGVEDRAQAEVNALAPDAAREALVALAVAQHARYPQYDGKFTAELAVARLQRATGNKGGGGRAGDYVLIVEAEYDSEFLPGDAGDYCSVWNVLTRCPTVVPWSCVEGASAPPSERESAFEAAYAEWERDAVGGDAVVDAYRALTARERDAVSSHTRRYVSLIARALGR